jgi:mRNA interferase RelE/StbE
MPQVEMSDAFDKQFRRKPADQRGAIAKTMKLLADNPHHPSLRSRKTSVPNVFYAKVTEGDRLSYEWNGPKIRLRHNCHHDALLRNP